MREEDSPRRVPVPHPVPAAPLDDAAGGTMSEAEQEQPEQEPEETPTPPETLPDEEEQEDGEGDEGEEEIIARVREAAPPPDAAKEQRRIEQGLKREQKRHADNIQKLLGPAHEDLLACPLCFEQLQGFVFPGDGGNLRDDQRQAALAFMGAVEERKLKPAEGVHECDRCDGWGWLEYPTKVEHVLEQACPRCGGLGYVADKASTDVPTAPIALAPAAAAAANGGADACPVCGQPGMAGQQHWCTPTPAAVS